MTSRPRSSNGTAELEDLDSVAVTVDRRKPGARDGLIALAVPFADRLARRFKCRGQPMEDLEQVARLGLVKAVDRYDPERGSFTAYALTTMMGELKRYFRDQTWDVHVPRRLRDLTVDVDHATSALTHELARPPTTVELAQRLDIDEAEIRTVRRSRAGYSTASLNAPVVDDGSTSLEGLIGITDAGLDSTEDRLALAELVNRLPRRDRHVLAMRFYGNCTQAEIAAEFGISQMHVSRILTRALGWLREAMLADHMPSLPPMRPAETADLTVTADRRYPACTLRLVGDVTHQTADQLSDILAVAVRSPITDLYVDVGGVRSIDAAGAGGIVAAYEMADRRGVRLRLTEVGPCVERTLLASRLGSLLS
jgi:RNA polymerase sigma-B factor